MEKLTEKSCAAFTEALAARTPVPGGGGAAAVAGALSAALCAMAGSYTVGKKQYAAVERDVQGMLQKCQALRLEFLALAEADAEAFAPLAAAYAIPKDDPTHDAALEKAGKNACAAPLALVRRCGETVELLEEMLEKGSAMLLSDVGCGALLCRAAMESAALNVFVNTAGLKDHAWAQELEAETDGLLRRAVPRAEKIAQAVAGRIRKER
jgi:formiminotetrahydrofolate cyclodeaminase